MRRIVLTLLLTTCLLAVQAQRFAIINGKAYEVADIEKITYEGSDFYRMLPDVMGADQDISIFCQALQVTGLVDTLQLYLDKQYVLPERYCVPYIWNSDDAPEMVFYPEAIIRRFTVFAETNEVLAEHGINSLDDLSAYAKRVYDELYPGDASVTDATNPRHSLHRFVAYHILRQGLSEKTLLAVDGFIELAFDRNMTDISEWYETMAPHAALKCSYPQGLGLFLNRRGIGTHADNYGVQIDGVEILPVEKPSSNMKYTHLATNGYYYHLGGMLVYDAQTRDVVLGGERWRVDAMTMSPDILNNYERNEYAFDNRFYEGNNTYVRAEGLVPGYVTNFFFGDETRLLKRLRHTDYSCYEGDELRVIGDSQIDLTVKLPPLPAGEWEVRMGAYVSTLNKTPTAIQFYLDDEPQGGPVNLTTRSASAMWLGGPLYYHPFSSSQFGVVNSFSNNLLDSRLVIGRFITDGESDHFLRLVDTEQSKTLQLDYLEFYPVVNGYIEYVD